MDKFRLLEKGDTVYVANIASIGGHQEFVAEVLLSGDNYLTVAHRSDSGAYGKPLRFNRNKEYLCEEWSGFKLFWNKKEYEDSLQKTNDIHWLTENFRGIIKEMNQDDFNSVLTVMKKYKKP